MPLNELSEWASVLTAGTAVLGVGFAVWQVLAAQRNQREATAKGIYERYLQGAYKRPDFAVPDFDDKLRKRLDFDARTFDGGRLEFERYEWFVHLLLNASDEILNVAVLKNWQATIIGELEYHRAYFRSCCWVTEDFVDVYSDELLGLVRRVIA